MVMREAKYMKWRELKNTLKCCVSRCEEKTHC